MGYGYRLFQTNGVKPVSTNNPLGAAYALAEMDPDPFNVANGHRNVWVEASLDARRDWLELFGPAQVIHLDIWSTRSNDPNRIGVFPDEFTQAGDTGDNGPVLAAIAAVSNKVDAVPTATENGDASRAAIVK